MPFKPHFAWDLLPADEIHKRLLRALQNHLNYISEKSDYYSSSIPDCTVETFEDFAKLPVTTYSDIVKESSLFFSISTSDTVESVLLDDSELLFLSLSSSDLDRIAYDVSLFLHGLSINKEDTAVILSSLENCESTFLSIYKGLTAMGTKTLRMGNTLSEKVTLQLKYVDPQYIITDPGTLEELYKTAPEVLSNLEAVVMVSDSNNYYPPSFKDIEKEVSIYCMYHLPVVSSFISECTVKQGFHIHPELTYVEVLDDNDEPCKEGEMGYLTITPFGIEGLPLLRYKTTIRGYFEESPCPCGRNSVRIFPELSTFVVKREIDNKSTQQILVESSEIQESELSFDDKLIKLLSEYDQIGSFIIEYRGKKGSNEIYIHGETKPAEVNKLKQHIFNETGRSLPIVVSNRATINAMKSACNDKNGLIMDNRG